MRTLTKGLLEPLMDHQNVQDHLKQPSLERLDVFVKDAAGPISDVLVQMAALNVEEVAKNLPDLMGFLGSFKDELCREGLSKRLSQQLMGRLPTQRLGHGAAQKLAVAGQFEARLTKSLEQVGGQAKQMLKRHLPLGGIRGRAFEAVLKAATKYEVRAGGFEGSVDMVWMAWSRSRVELSTDENELQYLQDKLQELEKKESTANNWRDTAEGWISVLQLRGQLRVQCGQAVLECMCSDVKVLEALGAAKALMHIEGDAPPAALVTIIAQGPGAHIRKHAYRYTKRIAKELVLIRRVKELQSRAVTGLGTVLVATSVAVGNYFSRVMYDGVTEGFGKQPVLMWVLPFAVLAGLLVLGLACLAVQLCRKGIFWKSLRACCLRSCCCRARVAPHM